MLVDMEKSVRKRVMLREKRETGTKFARREFEQEKERDTAVSSTRSHMAKNCLRIAYLF